MTLVCQSFVGRLVAAFRMAIAGGVLVGEGKLAFLAWNSLSSEPSPIFFDPNVDPLPQLQFHLRVEERGFVLRWSCLAW